ncbi:MAG TPA: tRNA (adenosine(37)-N6)-dimethylallyltransferase MiaA [Armatimonadota bacterium]|jgi:tRNA dimethylallyltransferase
MIPLLPLICGPTAVGKTALSLGVARALNAEIVSADSMAVYCGLEVATAKPTDEERRAVPHHLVDVVDVSESFSVAEFHAMASAAIDEIVGRGRLPLVVGGTRQYVEALTKGFSEAPPSDPAIRARLEGEGLPCLRPRLEALDPLSAARLHPHDLRRTVRALEVLELTGETISQWQQRSRSGAPPYRRLFFGLTMDREALYDRINRRVDAMMADGLEAEVRSLLGSGRLGPTAIQGHGYKEIAGAVRGEYSLEYGVYLLKRNTRWHARHQLSWLRQQPDTIWVDVSEPGALDRVISCIRAASREACGAEAMG